MAMGRERELEEANQGRHNFDVLSLREWKRIKLSLLRANYNTCFSH